MIEIRDKSQCSGCFSCANICPVKCISMEFDNEGFWYPVVDKEKCIDCDLCQKRCSILNDTTIINTPVAYACYSLDQTIRKDSSSGGLFSLLASKVINSGGVVYGAAFNDVFDVEHIEITRNDELFKLQGSKYIQSKLGQSYTKIKNQLEQGKFVYFSGTPCQIDGLLCFLNKKYENLICQDIICHGVPSPKVWEKYKKAMSVRNHDIIEKIQFRNKKNGWDDYNMVIKYKNTEYVKCHNDDLFMKAFLNNLCLRPSCYACSSKSLHRKSDITLGDFWGVDKVCPDLYDNKGTSLVFINSSKGQKFFNEIMNDIRFQKLDINDAIKFNTAAIESVKKPKNREKFICDILKNNDFETVVNVYTKVSIIKKLKIKIYKLVERRIL